LYYLWVNTRSTHPDSLCSRCCLNQIYWWPRLLIVSLDCLRVRSRSASSRYSTHLITDFLARHVLSSVSRDLTRNGEYAKRWSVKALRRSLEPTLSPQTTISVHSQTQHPAASIVAYCSATRHPVTPLSRSVLRPRSLFDLSGLSEDGSYSV
jgi:hypothetical protein